MNESLVANLLPTGTQEVQYKSAITLSAKNGIRMVPRLREQPATTSA
jgi:hypothetical protein